MSVRRTIEVTVDGVRAPAWQARLAPFCAKALRAAGQDTWSVAILLCGDRRMAELNARYRGEPSPTDVLSFPSGDGAARGAEGDMAISLDTMRRNAAAFGCTADAELKRLAVHGLLHLVGMDHGPGDGGPMLALQEHLLEQLAGEHVIGGRAR